MYSSRGGRGGAHGGRGGGSGGSCFPPHLKGKAIGLYYRDRQKRKHEEGYIRLNPQVNVPPSVQERIAQCLSEFNKQTEGSTDSTKFIEDFQRIITMSFSKFILEAKAQSIKDVDSTIKHQEISQSILNAWQNKRETPEYKQRLQQRQNLPAMQQSANILEMIATDQVVLVVGATGCGKTTQIPQILLDDRIAKEQGSGYHIVCTQPRRISAITVAERVAYERNESLGQSVGYQIRLER